MNFVPVTFSVHLSLVLTFVMYTVWVCISGSILEIFKVNGSLHRTAMESLVAWTCKLVGESNSPARIVNPVN